MPKPRFVTLNTHRIAVQRWHQEAEAITFTTVVHGEQIGNDLVAEVKQGQITLLIEDETWQGRAQIADRRTTGAGPTAVHRIEIRFEPAVQATSQQPLTTEQKLDTILAELRALRQEVADLRGLRARETSNPSAPSGAATLLDFDIPVDDDTTD